MIDSPPTVSSHTMQPQGKNRNQWLGAGSIFDISHIYYIPCVGDWSRFWLSRMVKLKKIMYKVGAPKKIRIFPLWTLKEYIYIYSRIILV